MEEKFFFLYHMRLYPEWAMEFPVKERKWYIDRFILQKDRENESMEAARRKAESKTGRK